MSEAEEVNEQGINWLSKPVMSGGDSYINVERYETLPLTTAVTCLGVWFGCANEPWDDHELDRGDERLREVLNDLCDELGISQEKRSEILIPMTKA